MADRTVDPDPDVTGGTGAPGGAAPIGHEHRDAGGGWLRPTVFGMMDGLVSNFALIAGVAGASAAAKSVALAGVAGLVGGAFSMATGEFVSVQSQNESTEAELALERHELIHNAEGELAELAAMYVARGVDPDVARTVARQLSRDPDQALVVHAQEELGVDPHQLPSPRVAAVSSLLSFSVGAFIPLLPYLFGATSVWLSAVLAVVALFITGAVTSRFTSRSWSYAGARQLVLGVLAAVVTFGVGALFHVSVG
jgi:VIT1/CCC1 family predicted Fe2+/Mn2+ transporter